MLRKNLVILTSMLMAPALLLSIGCENDATEDEGIGGDENASGGKSSGGSASGGKSSGGSKSDGSGGRGGGGAGGEGGDNGEPPGSSCADVVDLALSDECDSTRKCNYEIAAAYCDDGDAAATAALTACFRLAGGCHTAADPGSSAVRSCLAEALSAHGTSESAAVRAAADDLCSSKDHEPLMVEVFAAMGGKKTAKDLEDCIEAAEECSEVEACLLDNLGVPAPASCG